VDPRAGVDVLKKRSSLASPGIRAPDRWGCTNLQVVRRNSNKAKESHRHEFWQRNKLTANKRYFRLPP